MPANKNFAFRIAILDECLRNRRRKWTLQDLIDTVNDKLWDQFGQKDVRKRTIQDDIKQLEMTLGAPIERRKEGRVTYFMYSDPDFSIKNLPISHEEVEYLKDAIKILKQVNDFKILEEVEVIVNKLQHTVDTNIPESHCIIQFEKHTVARGTEYIDNIFYAIKEKTPLRITYQSFNATAPNQFVFHPYLLKEYRNRWFLFGRKENDKKLTNLALDRIQEIKNSLVSFIGNDLFDPDIYFESLIGVTVPTDEVPQPIRIKVSRLQAPYIRTKPIHRTQQVLEEYPDGGMLIALNLLCNYELRSVLLGFGGELEVLEPQDLREAMKKLFLSGLAVYSPEDANRVHAST
ncbi:YafY family protein [Chitinophaga sp. GbtcB8]|uniref:helix-turn-helix transcriptional regulator n=1 Tax=Chitinophaga sp. GbtcB8 TaxID=2824753 RepID=UPI001C30FB53|nr:WYL domain-containing protein [Chitinophaga sp. GbtcB8]